MVCDVAKNAVSWAITEKDGFLTVGIWVLEEEKIHGALVEEDGRWVATDEGGNVMV